MVEQEFVLSNIFHFKYPLTLNTTLLFTLDTFSILFIFFPFEETQRTKKLHNSKDTSDIYKTATPTMDKKMKQEKSCLKKVKNKRTINKEQQAKVKAKRPAQQL